ncbi:MAG: sodium:proton antiporter [Ignavibacteria bacterium]|nr:sodium:proton antiporter [Ignavibacteria bacterium]
MTLGSDSPIIVLTARMLAPFIQLFALYVVSHGHYSPGGGFQGGAMFAASVVLMRLVAGSAVGQVQFKSLWAVPLAVFGMFVYAGAGLLSMAMGGHYLDYDFLPMTWLDYPARHSFGILIVEAGVALGVTATMILLYDALIEGRADD